MAVALTSVRDSVGISKSSSADYGLRDYGFVRIADCVRISCGHGLQDYGLFWGPLKFATTQHYHASYPQPFYIILCCRPLACDSDGHYYLCEPH